MEIKRLMSTFTNKVIIKKITFFPDFLMNFPDFFINCFSMTFP